jgi:6,7-dimethyl-8-ribityllumazine synthase
VSAYRGALAGAGRRFAIVISRFNEAIAGRLEAGARACLRDHGVSDDGIDVVSVPGAWELPFAARLAARSGRYQAVIAIGCVIRGETPHFDYIAGSAAEGLARAALDADVPVTFGVLTTETEDQALQRAGGRSGNKGWDAAAAALEMADLQARLRNGHANA